MLEVLMVVLLVLWLLGYFGPARIPSIPRSGLDSHRTTWPSHPQPNARWVAGVASDGWKDRRLAHVRGVAHALNVNG